MKAVFVEIGLILVGLTLVAGLYFWAQGKAAEMTGTAAGVLPKTVVKIVGVTVSGGKLTDVMIQNTGNSPIPVGNTSMWIVNVKRGDGSRESVMPTSVILHGSTSEFAPNSILEIKIPAVELNLNTGPANIMVSGPSGVTATYTVSP